MIVSYRFHLIRIRTSSLKTAVRAFVRPDEVNNVRPAVRTYRRQGACWFDPPFGFRRAPNKTFCECSRKDE